MTSGSNQFLEYMDQPPCLLLVEDDETDILYVKRRLKQSPYDIRLDIARDAEEALDKLRSARKEGLAYVLLTDINMPGMDGHQLIAEIRQDVILRNTVIFVLSSSGLTGDIKRAHAQNVAGYMTKQSSNLKRSIDLILSYCHLAKLPA